jgi:hypothetical protein
MSEKNNKKHYTTLNNYEKCLVNGFAQATAAQQTRTMGYPSNPHNAEEYMRAFRDFSLALSGIKGIDDHIKKKPLLDHAVRSPCLGLAQNEPLNLVAPQTPPAKSSVQRSKGD